MEKSNNSASKPSSDEVKMPVQQVLPHVPDYSQPEDPVIDSAHAAFEVQARRADYRVIEHLTGHQICNYNLTPPRDETC